MTLRIVLADDHAPFRNCLKTLLDRQPGLSVVTDVGSGHAVIAALHVLDVDRPDVVVLDMDLRDMSGLTAAGHILQMHPDVRILMLSWHDDLPFLRAALELGVLGYMLKDDPLAELVHAVREVADGRLGVSRRLQHALRIPAAQSPHSAD
jgi:DNA-binding NarL/FixJ family response regulator